MTQLTPRQIDILAKIADAIDAMAGTPVQPDPVTRIAAGDDLQAALDAAQPGDILQLADGATFVGHYTLGTNADFVTVQGNATLHSPSHQPALSTRPQASYWRFTGGLRFSATLPDGPVVRLGTGAQTAGEIPHHLIFDGVSVLGHPELGGKRGIEANANHVEIRNSAITGFWRAGQDAQAVLIWNAYGPLLIDHCTLEASGENFMSGGADPSIHGLIPSDITFTNNVVRKPLEWRDGRGTVKNLFELKNARRVIVRGNLFENCWLHGQTGYALVLKSTNQDGTAPWSETHDVLIEDNRIRNVSSGISLAANPERHPAVPMSWITIRRNHIETNSRELQGQGWGLSIQAVADTIVEDNTFANDGNATIYFGEAGPNERFVLRGNIINDRGAGDAWGIKGSGAGEGLASLLKWAPGHVYEGNLIVTPQPHLYGPAGQNRIELTMPADTTGYGARLSAIPH